MPVPTTARLDAIRSLAEVAENALPIGMGALFTTPDGVLALANPPQPSRLTFFADGLPFHAAVSPDGDGAICQIWAEIGHIPFTAQATDRRRRLLAVLRGVQDMTRAKFVVQDGKILLFHEARLNETVTAEILIHETVGLLQEARPFLRLLGEQL